MATARLVARAYSAASGVSVSQINNAYTNTDSTTYATFQTTSSGTSNRYIYLNDFNFEDIPSNAIVNSFTVKIKGYESGINTSASYAPRLSNDGAAPSGSVASTNFGTSVSTITIPNGSYTWDKIVSYGSSFGIQFNARRNSRNTASYIYIYGAEILVDYTAETVHPTSVSLDESSISIEEGETFQLTETVLPANATNKSVTWSSSNTSVATVSNGVVTGVAAGSATITVTTVDGGKTDTCSVTVTAPHYTEYVQASSLVPGKEYLIVSGNSGSVYLMSNEAAGSGSLKGIAATVTNGKISITGSVKSKALFTCELETAGNNNTTLLKNGNEYLYCDSTNHLRMVIWTSSYTNRYWHYKAESKYLLWFFKGSDGEYGYTDTSSTYKYYLEVSSGNFVDNHVSTTSLANTNTPAIYIFEEASDTAPVITVGTPNKVRISDETGYNESVCVFTCNQALTNWEARAVKNGVTPQRGVGTLVESGTNLPAGSQGTISVLDSELTNGDGNYLISVYGQNAGGVWSE